jgi:phospholipid-binding lipoprotein MlaA
MSIVRRGLLTLGIGLLCGCAHHPADDPADPLEPVNRAVFTFNIKADKYVLKPVALGYIDVVPAKVRAHVTNFFENLVYPKTIVNDALQAKFERSAADTGRFLLNSTAGIGGIFDVATPAGLEKHDEDFGQTLGVWGLGEGWYLMLPLIGPSDNRDFVGYLAGIPMTPTHYLPSDYDWLDLSLTVANIVNVRAALIPGFDDLLQSQFDQYLFVRTAYLQKRQAEIYDGNPPPEDLGNYDSEGSGAADAGQPKK